MKFIVVGCGRLGADLASRLSAQGHEITVIDAVGTAFSNLPVTFTGRQVTGNALHRDILHRAGIEHADGLATATNSDTLNVVVAHIAQSQYNVKNVIARNYDPHNRSLHEAFGLQVVSSSSWGAQRMEELLYDMDIRTVFSAGNGEVEIYEITIPEHLNNRRLGDLIKTTECIPVSLTRIGRAMLPDCDTIVQAGDVLNLSATLQGIQYLRSQLGKVGEA